MATVLGATIFGSLEAIRHEGQSIAATAATLGVAVSLIQILLRALPSLRGRGEGTLRDPGSRVTVAGLLLYFLLVGAVVVTLNL